MIVVLFLVQFIITAVLNAIANSVSDSFVGYTISDLIVRLLVAPLTALAAAVLFFELKALRGEPVLGADAGGQIPPAAPAGRRPAPPPPGPGRRRRRAPRAPGPASRLIMSALWPRIRAISDAIHGPGARAASARKRSASLPPHLVLFLNA